MSYPAQPIQQQPLTPARRAPGPVRGAAVLLILMAVGGLVYGAIGLALMPGIVERFQSAAEAGGVPVDDVNGGTTLLRGVPIAAAFVSVVATVLLVVLAIGIARGTAAVRVATWVVCAIGLVSGAVAALFGFVQRVGSFDNDAVLVAIDGAHPSWWPWTSAALSVLQALGYVVVALLLALPASNAYFKRTPSFPPSPTGTPQTAPPPPTVDPTDWQRPDPPATTPAAM
ncbi:hypothetical protein [Asanoa iriomotensis]|uniref:DUF2567 domain-containing protein n=1 Tax=Asanoa iriomotensis TaxID=234613 RepID=A0ABQ4C6V9_9ACTN|nr:hypothetical protein [Asanoa iriomotensis]GIF58516.1 hypothetical protein Air01nite_46110 [Asanoa iriomotensis]